MTAPSGFLFILFGEEGRSWAEERLQKSAEFPGMVVLDAKENAMMETKAPYFIGRAQDEALLQLSSDVRFAFAESATTLWDDDDFDGF